MKIATEKVVHGNVVVEGEPLQEGASVTVLVREADEEGFNVTPGEKAALLKSMAQARQGELIDAQEALSRLK